MAGLSLFFGIGSALLSFPAWLVLVWSGYLAALRQWLGIAFVTVGFLYATLVCGSYPLLSDPLPVEGKFSISSLQKHHSPFTQQFLYRGTLLYQGHSLPCTIVSPSGNRPLAHSDYRVQGILTQRGPFDYSLKPKEWEPIAGTFSLAEQRYRAKEKLSHWIGAHLHRHRTASLLSALATGDVEERLLRFEFSRLGLQHLLAISGFHFGILIAFLSAVCSLIVSDRWQWLLMLTLAWSYFLFIGPSASVQRAWIVVSLFLLGKILRRPSDPINLLGAAFLAELLWNPLMASNLACHLSFGSSFGILCFHRLFEERLRCVLPRRSFTDAIALAPFSRPFYLLSTFLRQGIALSLAVNLMIFPLLLHHFGKFPLLSLLYNLFYPLLIGIALIGLLIALSFSFCLEPLSFSIFAPLDWYTEQLLQLTSYPPLSLDHALYFQCPGWLIPIYYMVIFIVLFVKNNKKIFN